MGFAAATLCFIVWCLTLLATAAKEYKGKLCQESLRLRNCCYGDKWKTDLDATHRTKQRYWMQWDEKLFTECHYSYQSSNSIRNKQHWWIMATISPTLPQLVFLGHRLENQKYWKGIGSLLTRIDIDRN